jgi:hypothetical protein
MGTAKVLATVAVGGAAILWAMHRDSAVLSDDPDVSVNGFVHVVMPDGAKADTVLIFTPPGNSSKVESRAKSLRDMLVRLGIPTVRIDQYPVSHTGSSEELASRLKRTKDVLEGSYPVAFVNGMARTNPSAAVVAAEFERTKRGK